MSFLNVLFPFICVLCNVISSSMTNFTTTSFIDNVGTKSPTVTTINPTTKPSESPTMKPTSHPTLSIPDGKITLIKIQSIICGINMDTFKMEKDAFLSIYSNVFSVCSNGNNICQFDDNIIATSEGCSIAPPNRRRLQGSGVDVRFKIGLDNSDDVETVLETQTSTNAALTNAITAAFPGTIVTSIGITDISIVDKDNEFIIDKETFGEKIFTKYLFIGITILFVGILWLILLTSKIENNSYHRLMSEGIDDDKKISSPKAKPMETQIEMQEHKIEETKQDTNDNNNNNETNNETNNQTNETNNDTNADDTNADDSAMPATIVTPPNNTANPLNATTDDDKIIDQQTMDELEDAWNSADDGNTGN